ncbi:DNA polymerase III subunit gamma/tau [Siminovitchia sediminis]|uniref:DNA-directed DNA polymerase n=1 Tax=Siminovitchia sediminis TaxID=1274353 RepID=A0ABW4KIZ4_9BACI
MSYQALYRVWRPQSFSDVIGQEHVTKTLQNALLQEKISHAYLFSGPRGTGKTSAAKIMAKAVNCEKMPVSEPCNKCPACLGITDGSVPDVIEIDAASNNGVEEIRDIRDKVKYTPNAVKYKVYIIDEVHMLTIGAFNALLKTLEEPPQHVIFILATTEPHKIPLTIISRCQRFDFKRITSQDIARRMAHIANETSLEYDEKALQIIARAAEGGMRDALSLLDQAISFSTGRVTVEDALTVTGSISQNSLYRLARAVHEKDTPGALGTLEELLMQGKDPARLIEDFILYYRDLLLYKTAPHLDEMAEHALLDEEFKSLGEEIQAQQIYDYIDILSKTQQDMRFSNHARMYVELCLVKLCQLEKGRTPADQSQLQQLIKKVEELEKEVKWLKSHGPQAAEGAQGTPAKPSKRPLRSSGKEYRVPAGAVTQVLKEATRQQLNEVKSHWGDFLNILNQRQMRSQAALLNDAEPAAASAHAVVIKFKYDIHCRMAMENHSFIQTISQILEELLGSTLKVIGVPEVQWKEIREDFLQNNQHDGDGEKEEEDPLVSEALKLVGKDLIEFKN